MTDTAALMNRDCRCISIDRDELSRQLELAGVASGIQSSVFSAHQHLFASVPVFMSREHLVRMQGVVSAVETVVASPAYRERVTAHHPAAQKDVASRGVFYGYDFHIGESGPQLIEINTNAGGALLNVLLARAQKACCEEMRTLALGAVPLPDLEAAFFADFVSEWRAMRGEAPLSHIVIVDSAPEQQFLYPEFLLFKALFEKHGVRASIAAPEALRVSQGGLWLGDAEVDLVYNRLTDFYFDAPESAALRTAWQEDLAVITPHPRGHALYAKKDNLVLLSNAEALSELGVPEDVRRLLLASVPQAIRVAEHDVDTLWRERKRWFFKPTTGYGSKAAYRGDKLTKGTFADIVRGDYIAQAVVPPSERTIELEGVQIPLKLDVRNYTYAGRVQLVAARLYHGQTTNFRTQGGGFAPVFTEARS